VFTMKLTTIEIGSMELLGIKMRVLFTKLNCTVNQLRRKDKLLKYTLQVMKGSLVEVLWWPQILLLLTAAQCVAPGDDTMEQYSNIRVQAGMGELSRKKRDEISWKIPSGSVGTVRPISREKPSGSVGTVRPISREKPSGSVGTVQRAYKAKKIHILPGFKKIVSDLPGGRYGRQKRMINSYQPHVLKKTTLLTDHYHVNDLAIIKLTKEVGNIKQESFPQLPSGDQHFDFGYELSFPRNLSRGGELTQREFNLLEPEECQRRIDRMDRIGLKTEVDEDLICGVEKYSGGSTCDRELGGGLICQGEGGRDTLCGVQIFRACRWSVPNGFMNLQMHMDWPQENI